MSPRSRNVQSVEKLLGQVTDTADRITRASARQAREIDRQLKQLIDRGEASTERALTRLDDELRSQLAGLRSDLRSLERHVAKLRSSAVGARSKSTAKKPSKKAAPSKRTAKKATKKKASVPAKTAPRTKAAAR